MTIACNKGIPVFNDLPDTGCTYNGKRILYCSNCPHPYCKKEDGPTKADAQADSITARHRRERQEAVDRLASILLGGCRRCKGNLLWEDEAGEMVLCCLQCGNIVRSCDPLPLVHAGGSRKKVGVA